MAVCVTPAAGGGLTFAAALGQPRSRHVMPAPFLPDPVSAWRRGRTCAAALALTFLSLNAVAAERERWLKVTAPEFSLVTTLREKDAQTWAGEFAQFVAALQEFIPINPRRLPRLTIVVFARERDFARFMPLNPDGRPMEVAGFFSRSESWAVAGLAGSRMDAETRSTIFHEGTHWFLSGFELPNPVWLEEGLAEVFSTFALEGKRVAWGQAIEPHVLTLRTVGAMPLERLLFLARDHLHGPGERAEQRTDLAYAQSWAFVHYLIFGQREGAQNALMDYVGRLRTAVHPDEAFRQAFGATYAEIDRKLAAYLASGRYYVARQPPKTLPAPVVEPAGATEVEEALIRLRLAGGRLDEARASMARALNADPADPRLQVLKGEIEQQAGDEETALSAYRAALAHGTRDFRPHYATAEAEHLAALARDATLHSLPAETARGIANGYQRAINLHPRFREAYQGLAGVIHRVPPGNTEDRRFLEFGLKRFPDDGMIRLGLAMLHRRDGEAAEARTLLAAVLADVTVLPPAVLGRARLLESEWDQNDMQAKVDALMQERKFAEAAAVVDARLEAGVDLATRQRLHALRGHIRTSGAMEEIRVAMEERRWADARTKAQALIESDASPLAKNAARRMLEQLDQRGLGKKRER